MIETKYSGGCQGPGGEEQEDEKRVPGLQDEE